METTTTYQFELHEDLEEDMKCINTSEDYDLYEHSKMEKHDQNRLQYNELALQQILIMLIV